MTASYLITPAAFVPADQINAAVHDAVENGMRGAVAIVVADAKRSVSRGGRTGRIYRRGSIQHQASAPGEPPKTDTGALVNSITGDVDQTGGRDGMVRGIIRAAAEYAGWLEFGTRHMAARPFLNPAIERNRAIVREFLARAVRTGLEQFRRFR